MKEFFILIIFLTIIICSYFLSINIDKCEKYLLAFSIFFQLITIFSILYSKFNYIIKYIDKIFLLNIIFGIFIIKNYYLNFFVINLLLITLLSRNYYNKCLFFLKEKNNNKNIYGDVGISLLLLIYLIKLIYKKNFI